MKEKTIFRGDIAGLRALAVLSVLFYHYGFALIPGGFVGVDIFFVISGYLITKIITDSIERDQRSITDMLWHFYYRRIQRIVPALAAVVTATLVAGWFILMPPDYANLGESAAYSVFGLANLYFFWNTGYFDRSADLQPLLNMWSLGVEEQFYLVWPIIIAVLISLARGNRAILISVIGSLIVIGWSFSVHLSTTDPSASFYLPHARAWELAVGALLAFMPRVNSRIASEIMCIMGLTTIFWSFLSLTGTISSTAQYMLAPVGGAALIVWPRTRSFSENILYLRPMQFFGNISYSLYLIHWPILVMFRYYNGSIIPTSLQAIALAIAATILSYASWRYVEQPVRTNRSFWSKRRVFLLLTPAIAATAACGIAITFMQGFPYRLPASSLEFARFRFNYAEPYQSERCFLSPEQTYNEYNTEECLSSDRPTAILWGDSFAAHYYTGLSESFNKFGISISQMSSSLCPPIIGRVVSTRPNCKSFNDYVIKTILDTKPDIVIFSAYWPSDDFSLTKLIETIEILNSFGTRTVVLGQGPYYRHPVPNILAQRRLHRNDSDVSGRDIDTRIYYTDQKMRQMLSDITLYVSVIEFVCPQGDCPMAENGTPFHWDSGHLTTLGSQRFAEVLAPEIIKRAFPSLD